jgi:hypothetical protein
MPGLETTPGRHETEFFSLIRSRIEKLSLLAASVRPGRPAQALGTQ